MKEKVNNRTLKKTVLLLANLKPEPIVTGVYTFERLRLSQIKRHKRVVGLSYSAFTHCVTP